MNAREWRRVAAILMILLAAFALRGWMLDSESIWHDEAWSIRAFRSPFGTPDDNTPYLYYLSGHLLGRLGGGETPFALRYVSVLIGVLTVALAFRVGGRWFGWIGGAVGAMMVGVSPLLWEYSQEVRAYVAVPLVALAMIAVTDAISQREQGESVPIRLWMGAFAVQVAALYTHNLSVPLVVWMNAALGLLWLFRRDFAKMLQWAGVEITVILAYVPWLMTQSPSGTPLNTPPQPSLALVADIWASYFFPAQQQLIDAKNRLDGFDVLTPLLIVGVIVAGLSVTWFARKRERRAWILLSHAALVPAFTVALMLAAHIDFHPRYFIAGVPGTLLLIVGNLTLFKPGWTRSVAYGVTVVLALVLMGVTAVHVRMRSNYRHDDFRGIADYYATLPEEAVILVPFDVERALQDYYAERLPIRAEFVNLPLYADEQTVLETINALVTDEPRRIEFLTWFQLPADVRGMIPCLLTTGSAEVEEARFYFGLSTQAFWLDRPITLQTLDVQPHFGGLTFKSVAYAASEQGACVRTSWTLPAQTEQNFSVAAIVENPLGAEMARADAAIARDDNAPTLAWVTDDQGAAYALLTLPMNAPLRDYPLTFGVYSDQTPSGLDLLDADGNPAGKSARGASITAQGESVPLYAVPVLLEDNALPNRMLETGRPFDVTVYLPDAVESLRLAGEGWQAEQAVEGVGLVWARFRLAPGQTGNATLLAGDEPLGAFNVVEVERIFDMPPFGVPVDVVFEDVGVLVGADVPQSLAADDATVRLIWRGIGDTERDYIVFVQLISSDGQVIAQSDSAPLAGARPTSGWVDGEFIVDEHTLRFNLPDYAGEATLIAGFYDPADFARVRTIPGADHAVIGTVMVTGE